MWVEWRQKENLHGNSSTKAKKAFISLNLWLDVPEQHLADFLQLCPFFIFPAKPLFCDVNCNYQHSGSTSFCQVIFWFYLFPSRKIRMKIEWNYFDGLMRVDWASYLKFDPKLFRNGCDFVWRSRSFMRSIGEFSAGFFETILKFYIFWKCEFQFSWTMFPSRWRNQWTHLNFYLS